MITIADISRAVISPYTVWRTLSDIKAEMCGGRPYFVAGNAAVSFRVEHKGQRMMLKCFTRTNPRLQAIYGEAFHPRELCVSDISGRNTMVDCLLVPYIEGYTLDEAICRAEDSASFRHLAEAFDLLAMEILSSARAHGDLKPENIIVGEDGTMKAIDWDAAFIPSLAGETALEIGTAAYQHPARTIEMYDKHLDDYSIALISTLLHLAAADPSTISYYKQYHEPQTMPHEILSGRSEWLTKSLDLLAAKGMAAEYRIARMLLSPTPHIFDLERILRYKFATTQEAHTTLTLDQEHGLWGCRSEEGWAVAPLFDSGFEPMDGMMLATLAGYKHFVATDGRILKSFSADTIVKPLRGARAKITDDKGERTIDITY